MSRPVVIVDPRSSGVELSPAFRVRGVETIAIKFDQVREQSGFGRDIRESDFQTILSANSNLVEELKKYNPLAVVPGAEKGVNLAEHLCEQLTPRFRNKNHLIVDRIHKYQMQFALENAGLATIKTLESDSILKVNNWIKENSLDRESLVLKPPISAGSEGVFHIRKAEDLKKRFDEVFAGSSNLTGKGNNSVIVQELVSGTEYSVGTVSANGFHYLAHLIKYKKVSFLGRETVYDHVEFVDINDDETKQVFEYTKDALNALGIRWGACHNEVMMTSRGPRLIESVPRMTGGPVVHFARKATGSSQADKLVEAYIDGDVKNQSYKLNQPLVGVFLKAKNSGTLKNIEIFEQVKSLKTYYQNHIWVSNGKYLEGTRDYLTSLGIIALSGRRDEIFADLKVIRQLEDKLEIIE